MGLFNFKGGYGENPDPPPRTRPKPTPLPPKPGDKPKPHEMSIARAKLNLLNIPCVDTLVGTPRGVVIYAFLPEISPFRAQLTADEVDQYISRKYPDIQWVISSNDGVPHIHYVESKPKNPEADRLMEILVKRWHERPAEASIPLHEWLEMSEEEYAKWVEQRA